LRAREIDIQHHSCKSLCIGEIERFAAEADGSQFAVLETGGSALLFEGGQLQIIRDLVAALGSLRDSALAKSKCHQMAPLKRALSYPFFSMLRSFKGFKCSPHLTCGRCPFRGGSSIALASDTLGDLSSLIAAIRPIRVPRGLGYKGTPLYMAGPSAMFAFESADGQLLLPILNYPIAESNASIYNFVKSVRAHENKCLKVPFSLKLSSIIDERSTFAKESGIPPHLVSLAAYASVGLGNAFPLLTDGLITEVFVDGEGSFAYVDHRELGRCNTGVHISKDELSRLINFAKVEVDRCMDYVHPSLRASIKTSDFHVRVSVDAPPLSIEGTAVSVRKFCVHPLTLADLVSNDTLTRDAASYLEGCVKRRRSITIYGESGSGKTTLAVALDLLTPPSWRKISVESDVAENVSQAQFSMHQIRLLASGTTRVEQEKRTSILNSLLHKSPDYVFFGEVLSAEDSAALFQMLASGLRCIHTIHSESAEALLRRLVLQHHIPPESITDLDILVQMRKICEGSHIFRRLTRISEVVKSFRSAAPPSIIDIFRWSDEEERLILSHGSSTTAGMNDCPAAASLDDLV